MTRSDEQVLLRLLSTAQSSPSANILEKKTNKKKHPCVFYTSRLLCQTRLTLYVEQNDRSRLLVAVAIVGLTMSERESISCKF